MENFIIKPKKDAEESNPDYEQDKPKDGLAQKRNMLEIIEEKPQPFLNLDLPESDELKKTKLDYKILENKRNLLNLKTNLPKSEPLSNRISLGNKPKY